MSAARSIGHNGIPSSRMMRGYTTAEKGQPLQFF
jgi:hypothetical protein